MEKKFEVAVVGGGIAGYTAALTLKNLKIDYLWLGDKRFGGKVRQSEYVRNFPAFTGNGREFEEALIRQQVHENVVLTEARVDGIYAVEGAFQITSGKKFFLADAVILATGVDLSGGLKGEREFVGRGVSYCAVCDGALYRGRKIATVVQNERYAEEVEYLAGFAEEVHAFCAYRDAKFHAKNVILHTERPLGVAGDKRVERLLYDGGETEVSGVFFLRDATPPQALVGGLGTEGAHVLVGRNLETNIKGLFAAGDITGRPYQFAKAAGEGLVAAHSAKEYLSTRELNHTRFLGR